MAEAARRIGVTEQTFYRLRSECAAGPYPARGAHLSVHGAGSALRAVLRACLRHCFLALESRHGMLFK